MSERKFIAIGDIHGCIKSMHALIEKLEPWGERIFVFIGDYIDRGPASRQVVDYLIEFCKNHECIILRGNHEQMLLDAFESNDTSLWLYNGGDTTLRSYNGLFGIDSEHHTFYEQTQLFYDTENYFFVHAGLNPKKTIRESIEKKELQVNFLWERSHLKSAKNKWEKTVVFGHTPVADPIVTNNMIGIDTGCVYNQKTGMGKLTAVLLPEQQFIFQPCLDDV